MDNAAVASLVRILKHVLHLNILDGKTDQIQFLLGKANLFMDLSESSITPEVLENRIRDAAYWAEETIEIHISDQMLPKSTYSELNLKDIMCEFDSINKEMAMITAIPERSQEKTEEIPHQFDPYKATDPDPSSQINLVGINKQMFDLKVRLIYGKQSTLQIFPIVGMRGTGKSTMARELYNDLSNDNHFVYVVWVTVSQPYSAKNTIFSILRSLKEPISKEMSRETDEQLEKHVREKIKGRRYLFVVDNVCDTETWGQIRRLFPDDQNGSQIMLTTRLLDVAKFAAPSSNFYHLHIMDMNESWLLLRRGVFVERICPPKLEEIGVEIAKKCMGLPLVTSVMAGLLASSKSQDFWNLVLEDTRNIVTEDDENLLDLLSVCYNHLPHHLKPCFIYFGGFQADHEIRPSKIIRLWIAEGFIKPVANESLEETAEIYLMDLIGRNLVIARKQKHSSKVDFVLVNGILWELCQKKAVDEKLFWFKELDGQSIPQDTTIMCRITNFQRSFARSFLCTGNKPLVLADVLLEGSRLLKVLDLYEIKFHQFPVEILQLFSLRYLALTCHSTFPASISRFWNLQTLIIRRLPSFRAFSLPSEIWEMTQLRHIVSKEAGIWYRRPDSKEKPVVIQENMQTLTNMQMFGLTSVDFRKFPNLRKLGLICDAELHDYVNLTCLHKLEKLKCFSDWSPPTRNFLSYLSFPLSLKNLTLSFCNLSFNVMSSIGRLPYLQHFKLQKCDFVNNDWRPAEWNPLEGQFISLKILRLEDLNLVHWNAESIHFPVLEHLVIQECSSLMEIPWGIGEIPTLLLIEVDESNPSAVASANEIEQEQRDMGNEELKVVIHRS